MGCVQNDGFQFLVFRFICGSSWSWYIQWTHQLGHRYAKQWRESAFTSWPTHCIWTMFRVCYDYGRHVLHSCRLQSTTTSIQYFQGYKCETVLVWSSTQWETRFWFSTSHPTYYQMLWMFRDAAVFNQPLSFDTAEVTDVRVYLFGVRLKQWETRFWFSTSYPIIRWKPCLGVQPPSISH